MRMKMEIFKQYIRTNIAEMRPVSSEEITKGAAYLKAQGVSISEADLKANSPKEGDMIARNPQNHNDKWLVAKDYFEANFKEI